MTYNVELETRARREYRNLLTRAREQISDHVRIYRIGHRYRRRWMQRCRRKSIGVALRLGAFMVSFVSLCVSKTRSAPPRFKDSKNHKEYFFGASGSYVFVAVFKNEFFVFL